MTTYNKINRGVCILNNSPQNIEEPPDTYLNLSKNKQTEIIHKNSENLNQTKLMFRHAL